MSLVVSPMFSPKGSPKGSQVASKPASPLRLGIIGAATIVAVCAGRENRATAQIKKPVVQAQASYARGVAAKVAKLIGDGKAALAAKNPTAAKQHFEAAYWYKSSPDLLYYLGLVADEQGDKIAAFDLYRRYLHGGQPVVDEAQTEALRKRTTELPASATEVTVSGPAAGLLLVDGRLIGVLPLSQPTVLAPGPHTFALEAKGQNFQSASLQFPEGRTGELHLSAGAQGSLIAVLTLNSIAALELSAAELSSGETQKVATAIAAAARVEHIAFIPPQKLAQQNEAADCLASLPCRDRLASKTDLRYVLRVSLVLSKDPAEFAVQADLLDVASGLFAAHATERLKPASLEADLSGLTRKLFQQALNRPRGTLKIESSPPGATVFWGGNTMGTTPFERISLAGPHKLRLELAGHQPVERDHTVEPGDNQPLSITLTPTELPPPPPPPQWITLAGERPRSRNARWAAGGVLMGAGIGLLVFGGLAGSNHGACADKPLPSPGFPCSYLYDTAPLAAGLLSAGVGFTVGGGLLMGLPGRKDRKIPVPQSNQPPETGKTHK